MLGRIPACGVEARVVQADAAAVAYLQLRVKGVQLPPSAILLRFLGRRLLQLQVRGDRVMRLPVDY